MVWLGIHFGDEIPTDGQILLHYSHNVWLALLALLVASVAGYCAFGMLERVCHAERPEVRRRWCWLGACCLGGGIWAMHFVAMTALQVPIDIDYDILTSLLSLIVMVAAALLGMYTLSRTYVEPRHYLIAALAISIGMAAMHYIAMAAIRSEATQYYHVGLVALSMCIAIAASLAALLLSAIIREYGEGHSLLGVLSALAMGSAICSTHIISMLALTMTVPEGTSLHFSHTDDPLLPGLSLAVIAVMGLLFALGVAWVDKKLQSKELDLRNLHDLLREVEQEKKGLAVAPYDPLTTLPNRRAFSEHFSQKLDSHAQLRHSLAILVLNIDHFKRVNDSLGHDLGDELLKKVAERLRDKLPPGDIVAHLGSDEFCVLAELDTPTESRALSQRLMQCLKEPIALGGSDICMTISIGICFFPNDGDTCEELLKNAYLALYQAKHGGRNNLHFFSHDLKNQAVFELRLEEELHRSLANDRELVLYYQPILDLHTGKVSKLEALVRWQHPQLGMLAPNRFIGLAEASGFIAELDTWVLRHACQDLAKLATQGLQDLCMSVNCSALNLSREELPDEVLRALCEYDIRPQRLELEVTENALMSNINQALQLLERIRNLGVSISIDDFGTGYSSLAYLKRLPLDTLKIDRSFVMDLPGHHADTEIIQAIIGMAHTLHLRVVAEGVETPEQLDVLSGNGCDYIQGYLLSRPQPLDALASMLHPARNSAHVPPFPAASTNPSST